MNKSPLPVEVKGKRALGRGFSALLPPPPFIDSQSTPLAIKVAVDRIHRNPQQPRENFPAAELAELAQSIKEKGVLQPLIATRRGDGSFELIAGERRLRAAKLAGLKEVPLMVRQSSAGEALEVAVIENIQRADLNPIEEARAFLSLQQRFNLTQEDLAKRLSKSRSYIANALRLVKLPSSVQAHLANGELTVGQVRPLIGLSDAADIEQMAKQIIAEGLNARLVEARSAAIKATPRRAVKRVQASDAQNWQAIEDGLRRRLATKIKIRAQQGRGRIEIHFYSQEECKRLIALLQDI